MSAPQDPDDILTSWEVAIVHELRTASGTLLKLLKSRISTHGITLAQFSLLRELWAEDGIKQNELSERLATTQPATVVTLDSLEKRDLIRRERGTDDRRVVRIYLTPAGEALRPVMLGYAYDLAVVAVEGIAPEDREQVRGVLGRLRANLEVELAGDERAKRGA